jgi:acyl-CoA synthetase (NDP forming)
MSVNFGNSLEAAMLQKLLAPASIAVVGASEDTKKPGGRIVRNLLRKGYAGRLLLINPKASKVQGLTAYPSLRDLPETPELAFIAIPGKFVAQALTELAGLGTKHVIVLSAGFGEVDAKGKLEEQRLAGIASENGMILLGPNCLGVMSPVHAGKFAGLLPDMKAGGIDFISGSGATVDYLIEQAVSRGLAFHTFVTVGNSAQTGIDDVLALYDAHQQWLDSKYIMLYLENVGNPAKMLHHSRNLAAGGCLLMGIKSGVTEAGSRAAASHTGAMATRDTAVQALFDKSGIIRTRSRQELIDLAMAAVLVRGAYDGRNVAIITDAGGPGVMLADELNRQGFVVPPFRPETRKLLAEALPPGAGLGNPVDCLPSRNAAQISRVIEIVRTEEADTLDYIVLVLGDSGLSDNWPIYQAVIQAMDQPSIPLLPSFCTAVSSERTLERFRAAGGCYFEDEVALARALGRLVKRPLVTEPEQGLPGYHRDRLSDLLHNIKGPVSAGLTREVLAAAGIPCPAQAEIHSGVELGDVQTIIPFPWAMKVTGPLHKTDVGGVSLGIGDLEAASEAWDRLMAINGATGVLIQQTIEGAEVIMGLSREGDFGHLVAFGLGGIYAEALGDVHFRLAPLSVAEARGMVRSIKGLAIVQGTRGQVGLDLDVLADLLVRVSLIARDVPAIREMDINPVKGRGQDLFAVDARIIMEVK